jgi:hypothetical protein
MVVSPKISSDSAIRDPLRYQIKKNVLAVGNFGNQTAANDLSA